MTLRKGSSLGTRKSNQAMRVADALTALPTDALDTVLPRATRAELIDAHRWCERNAANNATRKTLIARELRKRQQAETR